MSESTCPKCQSPYGYPTGNSMMCPECGHEWNPDEATSIEEETKLPVLRKKPQHLIVLLKMPMAPFYKMATP